MKESELQRKIQRELKSRGWKVWKNHGSPFVEPGRPDLMGIRDGVFFAMETKTPSGELTAIQKRWLCEAAKRKAVVGVPRSVREALEILGER